MALWCREGYRASSSREHPILAVSLCATRTAVGFQLSNARTVQLRNVKAWDKSPSIHAERRHISSLTPQMTRNMLFSKGSCSLSVWTFRSQAQVNFSHKLWTPGARRGLMYEYEIVLNVCSRGAPGIREGID